jgi:valyl-tRNA synthetase
MLFLIYINKPLLLTFRNTLLKKSFHARLKIMNEAFLSPYNPQETEDKINKLWEASGYANPDVMIKEGLVDTDAESFSIVLPPPNVTGTLHTGHASMLAIEDIMVRYQRMLGRKTLWLPGTDHAAIATQSKVEKILSKEKIRKHDLGREEFLKRVNDFAMDSQNTILSQIKSMGATVDWSRLSYTLDEQRQEAVYTAFKRMYDDGLIYQGDRIVNWDPKGQTTISDDEVVRKESTGKFYYFNYGPFVIGTARPETKFADKYVIVHPDDERYAQYEHLQEFDIEWINGPLKATLIKDEVADMEMGSGAMTITPWHSQTDFELAEKYDLPKEQIIDQYGKLLPIAGEFAGMKISEAREKIVEKLQEKGLVVEIEENYVNQIATAERSGGIIEPQIMKQWWINTEKEFAFKTDKVEGIKKGQMVTLKEVMLHVVRKKQINILPDRFEKVYFNWIENLRPWNISRQIWFGHQVPVWYKDGEIYVDTKAPEGEGWVQDEDTLDTWFSSGLWTFSTLGWPNEDHPDFTTYHPTQVLETGHDILFFWVARMILMSLYHVGDIPFETVYLHGLIRDSKGRKMSKSLGNIVDPLDLTEKFGTDALRMGMIVGNGPGNDVNLDENKIKAYSKFANKLWNITRFVLTETHDVDYKASYSTKDQELVDQQQALFTELKKEMDDFKYYLVGEKLYHYAWHGFADEILEQSKEIFASSDKEAIASRKRFLMETLKLILKGLHPFMPFVTEEIWQHLPKQEGDRELLMVEHWPYN